MNFIKYLFSDGNINLTLVTALIALAIALSAVRSVEKLAQQFRDSNDRSTKALKIAQHASTVAKSVKNKQQFEVEKLAKTGS